LFAPLPNGIRLHMRPLLAAELGHVHTVGAVP
jgi:hypothetical protein